MRYLIGRYHEIALKGRNQWRFVDQVKQNLRDIFGDYRLGNMRSVGPRLLVPLPDDLSDEVAAERAALIFGLQNFSLSYSTPRDIESISREAIKRATGSKARTFAVRTKREDKRFAMNSVEIDQRGRRRSAGGARLRGGSERARAHDIDRDNERRRVRVGGQDSGRGRAAGGRHGARDGAAVGRNRLAGRGVSHDASRAAAGLRAFPCASAGVGGEPREGGRAGGASDAMAGAIDADAGAVRKFAARNRREHICGRCAWCCTAASCCGSRARWRIVPARRCW